MASIGLDSGGRRRILFMAPDGKRKTLRLGKASQRIAEAFKTKIESLVSAAITNSPLDDEVARWLASRDSRMLDKLARVGLIAPPHSNNGHATLGDYIDQYIATRSDVKKGTRINLRQARNKLVEYFGADKRLADITAGDADEFRLDLMSRLAENTARRFCGRAKQFFRAAVRKKFIKENPFGDMKGCGVKENRSRFYFISRQESQKVLEHCPDAEWRLIFALARFGGLRTPSETLALKWGHIDWERGRITINSPKTAHYDGKESRQIPLFPELRPYLEEVYEQAAPGSEWVITRYRDGNTNLRTQLQRIIGRAGLQCWPKLFQNLRSTRETELAKDHPIHVVCAWLGNSPVVAAKHYLQVTDADYEQGSSGTESGTQAAQNVAQQPAASWRDTSHKATQLVANQGVMLNFATSCATLQECLVTPTGFEPVSPA